MKFLETECSTFVNLNEISEIKSNFDERMRQIYLILRNCKEYSLMRLPTKIKKSDGTDYTTTYLDLHECIVYILDFIDDHFFPLEGSDDVPQNLLCNAFLEHNCMEHLFLRRNLGTFE